MAPNTKSERGQQLQQGHQLLTDVTDEDFADNAQLFTQLNVRASMLALFEAAANVQEISPHRYRNLVRNLNTKQQQIIYDRCSGNLVGYSDLGDINNHLLRIQQYTENVHKMIFQAIP